MMALPPPLLLLQECGSPGDPQPLFSTSGRRAGSKERPLSHGKGPPALLRGQSSTRNAVKLWAKLKIQWELQRDNVGGKPLEGEHTGFKMLFI